MDPLLIFLIGTTVVLFCIIVLKLHAVISLLLAALVTGLLTSSDLIINYATHSGLSSEEANALANVSLGKRVATAFGNTSGKIGLLIALASIIGTALMRSGGAERIVRGLLGLFRKKNTSLALLSGSFILAIPVFFDTVFYLMIPLIKSLGIRSPKKFGLYLMTVLTGGVMAHSLVPPTPGPLFVAEEMGIDHVINGGVHGVFVLSSNGEFYGFDFENQKRVIEITVEHVNGRIPVYAGASAITTKECIKLARLAEKEGADALTVLTPMYINPSENEMYDHFVTIAQSTKLPVLLYNNPGRTTNNIPIGLLKKLACVENIVGIKNTSLDFSQTIQYLHETKDNKKFKILAGTDYYIYSTLIHGGTGCVAGTANVAPKLVVEIYDRFIAGDYVGALEAQNKLIPLRNAYSYGSFPVVMKDCLNLMGLNVGHPVKPISHCSEERMEALIKILRELNLM